MRQLNDTILNNVSLAASANSSALDCTNQVSISMQAVVTGSSPNGTLKLQASNDPNQGTLITGSPSVPTHWTDIPNSSVSVAGVGTYLMPKIDISYQWVRAVYTRSSGSGNITAIVKTLGF